MHDQGDEITDALDQLHAGGWSIGDTASHGIENSGQAWVVTGSNVEGATCAEA